MISLPAALPPQKSRRYPSLDESQIPSAQFGEGRLSLSLPRNRTKIPLQSSLQPGHYTDCSTPQYLSASLCCDKLLLNNSEHDVTYVLIKGRNVFIYCQLHSYCLFQNTGWRTKCHTIDCTHNTFLLLQKLLTSGTELIVIR